MIVYSESVSESLQLLNVKTKQDGTKRKSYFTAGGVRQVKRNSLPMEMEEENVCLFDW